jgi:hypothetical protein
MCVPFITRILLLLNSVFHVKPQYKHEHGLSAIKDNRESNSPLSLIAESRHSPHWIIWGVVSSPHSGTTTRLICKNSVLSQSTVSRMWTDVGPTQPGHKSVHNTFISKMTLNDPVSLSIVSIFSVTQVVRKDNERLKYTNFCLGRNLKQIGLDIRI